VLDGQRSLFAAELTLAEARGNEYQSLVQLYRALGGGWQQSSMNFALSRKVGAEVGRIRYLLMHRPLWPWHAAVGKTLVSSGMIDKVVQGLGR
jgi:hypothetical protein